MKPFYRSFLFWLGLPGALFLSWMWMDSVSSCTGVQHADGARITTLLNDRSMIRYRQEPQPLPVSGSKGRFSFKWSELRNTRGFPVTTADYLLSGKGSLIFPQPVYVGRKEGRDSGFGRAIICPPPPAPPGKPVEIRIAHWFGLVGYVSAWSGMFYVRRRRWRRAGMMMVG
ncbi:hypothetical protein [Luteolibacter sp. Populi]|uniref:hypothetical protein n=1 Tax=Luteolibacter sp. Populi TaxID=3230487 RepID=UPI0034671574